MEKTPVELNGKTILVTGSPGFIGANLVLRLLKEMSSGTVVSLDNMNDYYDPKLKEYRLGLVEKAAAESLVRHVFVRGSIGDRALVDELFAAYHFDLVVNLAARSGAAPRIFLAAACESLLCAFISDDDQQSRASNTNAKAGSFQ